MVSKRMAAALVCGIALIPLAALAQNLDAIKERQQQMKTVAGASKSVNEMIKGNQPFDAAKAAEAFTTMNAAATKFGTLFPEDSKTGGDTEASPAIWEKPDEFQAKLAKFEADTAAAAEAPPADVEALQASFGTVSGNCRSCHTEFRVD